MAKQNLNTIKNWFKTTFFPTQAQFWDTFDSFWHKDEVIPTSKIENLDDRFAEKADDDAFQNHLTDPNAHDLPGLLANKASSAGLAAEILARQNADTDLQAQIDGLFSEVTVANITARNAYNIPKLPFNIFVTDDGDGKWALYKATSLGVNATYIKLSDPDLLNALMSATAIKAGYESNANTNAFTDALLAKLNGIAANATLNATATDAETQLPAASASDIKFISALKLANWWFWIKTQVNSISGAWTFLNKLTLASGSTSTPALIIPPGILTTMPQNGAIERGADNELYTTQGSIRAKIVNNNDPLVFMVYREPASLQCNLTSLISSSITSSATSVNIPGMIGTSSVLKLNCIVEIYFVNGAAIGSVGPTSAKSEIYLKLNNGLFATSFSGSAPVNRVKIAEYLGLANNGYKTTQTPIVFAIQNAIIANAQWSTIGFSLATDNNGVITQASQQYFLRDAANTRTFGASEGVFTLEIVNSITYADASNSSGNNSERITRTNAYGLIIEKYR